MLSETQTKMFNEYGYLVLDKVITPDFASQIIDKVNLLAYNLIIYNQWEKVLSANINLANAYTSLAKLDRSAAGEIFDTIIKIPELNRYFYHEMFEKLAKQLLKSTNVLSPPMQMNLRADHPTEEKFLYPWHTDYSYNFGSKNSIIFWIPLMNVDLVNGSLHVIPHSHLLTHNIEINSEAVSLGYSPKYFKINQIDKIINEISEIRCNLTLGQGLVFHSNLIHKSGLNLSNQIRYSVQSRWFDASSEDAIKNRYRGGIDEGNDPNRYLIS